MGKLIDITDTVAALGLTDLDTQVDPDGDTLAVALQGTILVSFVQHGDGQSAALQAAFHDHESVEEAQACAAEMMEMVRHHIAEYEAMAAQGPVIARSQLPAGVQSLLDALQGNQPYPSGQYI